MVDEQKIIEEDEVTEELSEEELNDMDDDEEIYDEEEGPVTKVINIVKQPVITSVIVGAEVDSKGAVKPMCKLSIERHVGDDVEISEYDIIAQDFEFLAQEAKIRITALKEKMN